MCVDFRFVFGSLPFKNTILKFPTRVPGTGPVFLKNFLPECLAAHGRHKIDICQMN